MLKEIIWLLRNPGIINRYNYLKDNYNKLERNNSKIKDENKTLLLRLHNIIHENKNLNKNLNSKISSINNNVKNKISQRDFYKKKYNRLNNLIKRIKTINNLQNKNDLANEIKNKLNMYNIYKNEYYRKYPMLNDIDNKILKNNNKSHNDISHYHFDFYIKNPMKYPDYYPNSKTLKGVNDDIKIDTINKLLKFYLKSLRIKNYNKFNELLFNTPKKPAGIFYNYINIIKQKENSLINVKKGAYKSPYWFFNKYANDPNNRKIDYTSTNKNSYFVSISSDILYGNHPYVSDEYYNFKYIFNTEKNIIMFELIRQMLSTNDDTSKNKIMSIIKNTKFKINTNKYITYPFYNGNNPNDYIIHDTKHKINLNKAYVPYNESEIEKEMKYIDKLTGNQFENYISNLLKKLGYEKVQTTQASNDYGLDNIGYNRDIKYGFQCKHYKGSVGYRAISEVASGCKIYNAKHGIVVTNSLFSKNAIKAANNMNIILWDREKLKNKIIDSGK